jgi:hypothetical protein
MMNGLTNLRASCADMLQFNGLVLQGFGFSTFHTLLLGIPGGAVVFIFVLLS